MRTLPLCWFLPLMLCAFGLPRASHAQETGEVVVHFDKKASGLLVEALKDGAITAEEAAPMPLFKVPTKKFTNLICKLNRSGVLACAPDIVEVCPESLPLSLPNGETSQVEVDCEGPDSDFNGTCECEFKEQS